MNDIFFFSFDKDSNPPEVIQCFLLTNLSGVPGVKLHVDLKFREKWLLPPAEIGRSDSQEGRNSSAQLRQFSFNFKEK